MIREGREQEPKEKSVEQRLVEAQRRYIERILRVQSKIDSVCRPKNYSFASLQELQLKLRQAGIAQGGDDVAVEVDFEMMRVSAEIFSGLSPDEKDGKMKELFPPFKLAVWIGEKSIQRLCMIEWSGEEVGIIEAKQNSPD